MAVVIPIQAIGFYNRLTWLRQSMRRSCHTYPNDRLLQLNHCVVATVSAQVVIPIQTIGFYNAVPKLSTPSSRRCHTYPNDRLLQPKEAPLLQDGGSCHTYPNDRLLQRTMGWAVGLYVRVVIPIQTIGFYNFLL